MTKYGLQKLNHLPQSGYRILEPSSRTKHCLENATIYNSLQTTPDICNLLAHLKLQDPSIKPQKKLTEGSFPCEEIRCTTCKINRPCNTFYRTVESATQILTFRVNMTYTVIEFRL